MNNSVPIVSVIMPVYNVSDFVIDAVESILNQTYKNFELIIVDDSSTDDTYLKLMNTYKNNEKVLIFKNGRNRKIVYSLNRALSYAKGKYIARIDGDDIAYPDRIERQMRYLENHPDVDLVGCDLESINEDGFVTGAFNRFPEDFETLKKMAYFCPPVSHIWLCKTSVYKELDGYRFPSVEDYDFLLRMITGGYRISNIPNYVGMKIRIRTGATSTTFGVTQRRAFNYVRQLYRDRLMHGSENIKNIDFDLYVRKTNFYVLHKLSSHLCKRAMVSNALAKYLLLSASALLSPYQAQYFYCRLRMKLILLLGK